MHKFLSIILMSVFLGAIHLGALYGVVFHFDLTYLIITVFLWQFFSLIGISVCYHREITHRAFKSKPLLRIFHLTCALIAGQAGPIMWAQVHRIHHRFSDREGDPHSPKDGFLKSHLGWIFNQRERKKLKHFQIIPADLENDKLLQFFQKLHFPFFFGLLITIYFFLGLKGLLWFGCVRITLTLNSAWIINSLGHYWGYQNYTGIDNSRNSKILAFFTGGEGFHNNHHRKPRSCNMGHRPGEFDLGFQYIRLMRKLKLIYDVVE